MVHNASARQKNWEPSVGFIMAISPYQNVIQCFGKTVQLAAENYQTVEK